MGSQRATKNRGRGCNEASKLRFKRETYSLYEC